MKNTKRIAIVGDGKEWSGLPLVRELGKLGYYPYIIFRNPESTASFSKYLSGKAKILGNNPEDEADFVIKLLVRNKFTYLFCLDEKLRYELSKRKETLERFSIRNTLPPFESYRIAWSKFDSAKLVASLGVPVPEFKIIDEIKELDSLEFDFSNLAVLKANRGDSSLNVRYASNKIELRKKYLDLVASQKNKSIMIQQFIGGPTYLTQAVVNRGEVEIVVPHYKHREWPLEGGISCRAETIHSSRLIDYMTKILENLNWHGEAGMEWKYDKETDDFYFIEINPRFEGSLYLAIKSGANLPEILMYYMEGIEPNNTEYKVGTHFRWFFTYDFRCFLNGEYNIRELLSETINSRINGELSFNDIKLIRHYWKRPFREIKRFISGAGYGN